MLESTVKRVQRMRDSAEAVSRLLDAAAAQARELVKEGLRRGLLERSHVSEHDAAVRALMALHSRNHPTYTSALDRAVERLPARFDVLRSRLMAALAARGAGAGTMTEIWEGSRCIWLWFPWDGSAEGAWCRLKRDRDPATGRTIHALSYGLGDGDDLDPPHGGQPIKGRRAEMQVGEILTAVLDEFVRHSRKCAEARMEDSCP